jgi:hypothetical protein
MSKWNEDKAFTQINEVVLERELQLDNTEARNQELQEIRDARKELMNTPDSESPDRILFNNIDRANELLDVVYTSIQNGGQSNARMFEVAAQLINAITSATTSIQTVSSDNMKYEYNLKVLELKEKELFVKQSIAQQKFGDRRGGNGKVIVTDRESLLRMIEKEDMEVEIESSGPSGESKEET